MMVEGGPRPEIDILSILKGQLKIKFECFDMLAFAFKIQILLKIIYMNINIFCSKNVFVNSRSKTTDNNVMIIIIHQQDKRDNYYAREKGGRDGREVCLT